MSYKTHQFWRIDTQTLIEYKVKCLDRLNSNSNGKSGRQYWFDRLESIETELNKRYNETYQTQSRSADYEEYFNKTKDLTTI